MVPTDNHIHYYKPRYFYRIPVPCEEFTFRQAIPGINPPYSDFFDLIFVPTHHHVNTPRSIPFEGP